MKPPKVFISHASEDKERFVLDFATQLRNNGVDAWVDQWEINPGDSLIDKIFEQGISEADAFIVILSRNSTKKPWVTEELNAASLKRIEKNTKVIPVIIDKDIAVPEVLKTTVWETIEDTDSYDQSLKKILASIFGVYEKPALGNRPAYVVDVVEIEALSIIDSAVFKGLGDDVFTSGKVLIDASSLEGIISQLGISENDLIDSLDILENDYLIKQTKFLGTSLPLIQFEHNGILKYAEHFIEDFPGLYLKLISLIVNGETLYGQQYAEKLDCSRILIDALLQDFEAKGYIRTHNTISNGISLWQVTAIGKRFFSEQLKNGVGNE